MKHHDNKDDAVHASREKLNAHAAYFERALQIIVGATITILAGFLSQIWSSAKIEFKSSLAHELNSLGIMFLGLILTSILRFCMFAYPPSRENGFMILYFLWGIMMVSYAMFFARIVGRIGSAIESFASVPI